MSLDLYMVIKSCEHCGQSQITDTLNITYNLWPMWKAIFPESKQMIDIDGMMGGVACLELIIAKNALMENPEKFIALNPENHWGCYADFVIYIQELIKLCKEYPDGVWHSDR